MSPEQLKKFEEYKLKKQQAIENGIDLNEEAEDEPNKKRDRINTAKVLNNNFAIKHIHGGEATKQKRLKEKEEKTNK